MPTWFPIAASTVLALIPVVIWLTIIHRESGEEEKSLYIKTFLSGTLAVVPPFILIFVFNRFPQLDIYAIIRNSIKDVALVAIFTNVVVGIIEEIAKNVIVRVIDKRHPEYVQTISAALRLSICAGLGFSFAENIFYFYNIWVNPMFGAQDLFSTFIFRSLFTMCGHMVFSGIFGYYFGLGKFAADLTEFARWKGSGIWFARLISKVTGKMTFQVVREIKNLQGLIMAMAIHASFNASLDLQYKLPSILIVSVSVLYVFYLLKTKSGHLMFSVTKRRASTMATQDQDVVMELLGMWSKEGRYEQVTQICDKLLERDPDNNVVKLFKAKAADNQKLRGVFESLKEVMKKTPAASGQTQIQALGQNFANLSAQDEKTVLELMNNWFQEEKYNQVLEVSKRLLERNPNSQGAKVLLDKAMDKDKVQRVFDSLSKLFGK
ncbi:PrsW family intramembrane metalloprotease [Candidatus Peregrinibacteria bacterium]|nr:PrsW family intramembrane metalloprotease [Candidatus Peregrinibacteria bacterium]